MIAQLAGALAIALTRLSHHLGTHAYLSTGCLHGDHAYCQGMTGLAGAKRPSSCKFCRAACLCRCHRAGQNQAEQVQHVGGRANAEDCPACKGTNPPYPFLCPGLNAGQTETQEDDSA